MRWRSPNKKPGTRHAGNAAPPSCGSSKPAPTKAHFGNLESDAFADLVATVPQTLAGAAAMLAYVGEWLAEGHSLYDEDETITLLASIQCAVCRAGGIAGTAYDLSRRLIRPD